MQNKFIYNRRLASITFLLLPALITSCSPSDNKDKKIAERLARDWVEKNIEQLSLIASISLGSVVGAGLIAPIISSALRDGPVWTFFAKRDEYSKEWVVSIKSNAEIPLSSINLNKKINLHGEGHVFVDVKRKLITRSEINIFKFFSSIENF